jgi:transposase
MEDRITMMLPQLNEMQKRLFLASEALAYGRGGIAEVIRITGVSRNTVKRGINELKSGVLFDGRVRKSGGGRTFVENKYTGIEEEIRKLIDGSTYGNPERVLSYTTESLRKIERELKSPGIPVSHETVGKILESMGYSKQANQKMPQAGETHPDRNARFEHINATAAEYIETGDPVISAGTKKKENIGNLAISLTKVS